MKEPWEWDENDLLALISTKIQESISLEYKESGSLARTDAKKKQELSKDVSAFANSAGGTIVYGMVENGRIPIFLDDGYDPSEISKEWVEQVINSNIQRRIDGIRINQVTLNKTRPGRVAYVLCIPQSLRAPHQAADKRFYKRFNFQSVPMEEYEVRDVGRRGESPDLAAFLELADGPTLVLQYDEGAEHSHPIGVTLNVENQGATPVEYAVFHMFVDKKLKIIDDTQFRHKPDVTIGAGSVQPRPIQVLQFNHSVPSHLPIFRGPRFTLLEHPLQLAIPRGPSDYLLMVQIHAPGMEQRQCIAVIHVDEHSVASLVAMPLP